MKAALTNHLFVAGFLLTKAKERLDYHPEAKKGTGGMGAYAQRKDANCAFRDSRVFGNLEFSKCRFLQQTLRPSKLPPGLMRTAVPEKLRAKQRHIGT